MIVSTKGRYALRVMVDLAEHQTDNYIPLKEIATRQGISEKYLENILKFLVNGKLLTGLRGKGGGYRLTIPPEQCTVNMVLRLTEGNMMDIPCLNDDIPLCQHRDDCRTYSLWKNLDNLINDYFNSITLADLMNKKACQNEHTIS